MENWELALDRWLTNPDEPKDSCCKCCECKQPLYYGEVCYDIDGDTFCETCAQEWLNCRKVYVDEDMQYG